MNSDSGLNILDFLDYYLDSKRLLMYIIKSSGTFFSSEWTVEVVSYVLQFSTLCAHRAFVVSAEEV